MLKRRNDLEIMSEYLQIALQIPNSDDIIGDAGKPPSVTRKVGIVKISADVDYRCFKLEFRSQPSGDMALRVQLGLAT